MDNVFFDNSNPYTNTREDLEKTFRFFKKCICLRTRSDSVLLDCAVSPNPRGPNKQWEIELSFFHVMFRIGKYMIGTPFRGYFSCHTQGDFTTYSISIEGKEFWFDQRELALASLSGDSPGKEQALAR